MKARNLFVVAAVAAAVLSLSAGAGQAANVYWMGTNSSDFGTGSNWSTGNVPGASDSFRWGTTTNVFTPVLSTTYNVGDIYMRYEFSGAQLTNSAIVVSGTGSLGLGGSFYTYMSGTGSSPARTPTPSARRSTTASASRSATTRPWARALSIGPPGRTPRITAARMLPATGRTTPFPTRSYSPPPAAWPISVPRASTRAAS